MISTIKNISIIAITIIIGIGVILGLLKTDKYLRLKAMGDCAVSSKYETTAPDGKSKVSYPVDEVYKKCLQEKGYSVK